MKEKLELLLHTLLTLAKLWKPGGARAVMAENIVLKQQLIAASRAKKRAPSLTTFDRFLFGFVASYINNKRLAKVAVILKPATIIRFHNALKQRKYSKLYSNKTKKKPGKKGPHHENKLTTCITGQDGVLLCRVPS